MSVIALVLGSQLSSALLRITLTALLKEISKYSLLTLLVILRLLLPENPLENAFFWLSKTPLVILSTLSEQLSSQNTTLTSTSMTRQLHCPKPRDLHQAPFILTITTDFHSLSPAVFSLSLLLEDSLWSWNKPKHLLMLKSRMPINSLSPESNTHLLLLSAISWDLLDKSSPSNRFHSTLRYKDQEVLPSTPELSTPLNAALSVILKHNLKLSSTTNIESAEGDGRADHVLTRRKGEKRNT